MVKMSFRSAAEALSTRNATLLSSYKEAGRGLLSRSVSSLVASIADQRREMGKEIASLAIIPAIDGLEIEIDVEVERLKAKPVLDASEARALLGCIQCVETEDYELLTAVSGASLVGSVEVAERLASLAEQSRKRASWAQDHLDLLGI